MNEVFSHALVKESGAAIIEFAMVLVLIFVLVFGIIEYALGIRDTELMSQVARNSARFGAKLTGLCNSANCSPPTNSVKCQVLAKIDELLVAAGRAPGEFQIEVDPSLPITEDPGMPGTTFNYVEVNIERIEHPSYGSLPGVGALPSFPRTAVTKLFRREVDCT